MIRVTAVTFLCELTLKKEKTKQRKGYIDVGLAARFTVVAVEGHAVTMTKTLMGFL